MFTPYLKEKENFPIMPGLLLMKYPCQLLSKANEVALVRTSNQISYASPSAETVAFYFHRYNSFLSPRNLYGW
jgi:hypothetical protein